MRTHKVNQRGGQPHILAIAIARPSSACAHSPSRRGVPTTFPSLCHRQQQHVVVKCSVTRDIRTFDIKSHLTSTFFRPFVTDSVHVT